MNNIVSKKVNILGFVIAILTIPQLTSAQANCVLKKDKDNIKVYSCETAGTNLRTVSATFELSATIEEYMAVVLDVDNYKAWHYRAINPRLLKKISATELIYYTQVFAPWPVSNRDLILRLKLEPDISNGALTVTLKSISDYLPTVNNVVRVPSSYSKMTLTPSENSKLKVEYFIEVDPGGHIPAWVVNLVSTQAPYETFKNLINRLERLKNLNDTASTAVY